MGHLLKLGWLVIGALACDVIAGGAASRPMMAVAMAPATPEEKAARKAARAEKQNKKAGKIAREKPVKKAGKGGKKGQGGKGETGEQGAPSAALGDAKPLPTLSPAAPGGPPLPPCPTDNVLTWRSFGAGFLLTWCTGCHSSALPDDARQGAPTEVDFDSYARYKPFERLVYDRAVTEVHKFVGDPNAGSPMPPAGVVPEADRKRLAQWIACGSPAPQ